MRPQIFGQDADILASRAGTTAGTVRERRRGAAWVQTSLEDCMDKRQHHLKESSSAGLGRSQKMDILDMHRYFRGRRYFRYAQIF